MSIYDFIRVPDETISLSTIRQKFLLFVLFFAVTLSLMAPIASDYYFPNTPDFKNHIAIIVQAKMALDQGQFPLRIAPYEHQSLGYPLFQFYGNLPYTLAGGLYKFWTSNPYVAFKITAIIAFMLAGVYSFRSAFLLTHHTKISTLAALMYMCTPYFIINLENRAAFTEFFAQGLLPVILFYSLAVFQSKRPSRRMVWLSLAWGALAMSHMITFVYTSFFMGLFFIILTLMRFQTVSALIRLGLCYLGGILLSLWILAPIGYLHSYLGIGHLMQDPFYSNWLTKLPTLLSFTATSPMPLPGNGLMTTKIYLSLGLPMLIALSLSVMRLFALEPWSPSRKFFCVTLAIYFLAFLMVWAPFDIYLFLPRPLDIAQFSYRLLSQSMWLGLIIFTVALSSLFMREKIEGIFIMVFAAIIFISTSPWIQTKQDSTSYISQIISNPETGLGNHAFLPYPTHYLAQMEAGKADDTHAITNENTAHAFYGLPCSRKNTTTVCEIVSKGEQQFTPVPAFYYPDMLSVTVQGKHLDFESTAGFKQTVVGIKLPSGKHEVSIDFTGLRWANWISGLAWILASLYVLVFATNALFVFMRRQERRL